MATRICTKCTPPVKFTAKTDKEAKAQLLDHLMTVHGEERDASGNTVSKPVAPEEFTALGLTLSEVEVIRTSVAKEANDRELLHFLHVAKASGLNPLLKEIYWMKVKGKATIMASRDGYLAKAQRNPKFLGLYSADICDKDEFSLETGFVDGHIQQTIQHSIGKPTMRGKIIGAWAAVELRDSPTFVIHVTMDEYGKTVNVWKQYVAAMIRKCAENIILKRCFAISGAVTGEEIVDTDNIPDYVKEILESEINEA